MKTFDAIARQITDYLFKAFLYLSTLIDIFLRGKFRWFHLASVIIAPAVKYCYKTLVIDDNCSIIIETIYSVYFHFRLILFKLMEKLSTTVESFSINLINVCASKYIFCFNNIC